MVFGRCRKRVEDEPETDTCPDKVAAGDESVSSDETDRVQVDDELDMMLDVILKLREDPEFAKSMYASCPRLQHLLNKHPDLRPIFEEPRLICINFEKVYTDAGGILPEDLEKNKPGRFQRAKIAILRRVQIITQSRAFKIFKWLLIIKKLMACLNPTKLLGFAKGCCRSMCCFVEDAENMLEDADGDHDSGDAHQETKEAVNKAADYMDNPEVQDEMNRMMENPETLQDAIEQNEQLRDLRDSNPVCAELMSDPDTMKMITDSDNLRALGDAPELLEADFADSGFEPPETEVDFGGETDSPPRFDDVGLEDREAPSSSGGFNDVSDMQDVDGVDEPAVEDLEANEDAALEEEEGMEGPTADDLDDVEYDSKGGSSSTARGRGQARKGNQRGGKSGGRFGGITDAAVGFIGGAVFGELLDGGIPGGGDEFDGIGDEVPDVEEVEVPETPDVDTPDVEEIDVEDAALAAAIGATAVAMAGDDLDALADTAKDQVDNMEDVAEGTDGDRRDRHGRPIDASGAVIVAAPGGERSSDEEEEEEEGPKGFRGFLSNAGAALKDTAKESLLAAFVGDDVAECVVDDLQKESEDEDDDEKDKKDKSAGGSKRKSKSKTSNAPEAQGSSDDAFAHALDD